MRSNGPLANKEVAMGGQWPATDIYLKIYIGVATHGGHSSKSGRRWPE